MQCAVVSILANAISKLQSLLPKEHYKSLVVRSCRGGYRHEFSHTFDNDIELNSRLIAVVFGLGCVVEFGVHLASGKRRSNKNNGGGAIIALVFIVLGLLGMLCARILQAVISRQKEFR